MKMESTNRKHRYTEAPKKTPVWKIITVVLIIIGIAAAVLTGVFFIQKSQNKLSKEFTLEELQAIVDGTFKDLPESISPCATYLIEQSEIKVNGFEYGDEKNVILNCSYKAVNLLSAVKNNVNTYVTDVYGYYVSEYEKTGIKPNSTKIKQYIVEEIKKDVEASDFVSGDVTLEIFEPTEKEFVVYLNDEVVDTVLGGLKTLEKSISSVESVEYNGDTVDIKNLTTIRNGLKECIKLKNYNSEKPDTSIPLMRVWNSFADEFRRNFIDDDRWTYLVNGLGNTLGITALAVILGIFIGFIVALIRCFEQKTGKLKILSGICKVYVTIIRGMPVMVQLLIVYFVILAPLGVNKFLAAVLCFGLNSGAYVSEIVRGGIMAVDEGQTEAGRSLGFTYGQTELYIVIPQAFKTVLPALANEFIALLKESSVAFYIGVADLTMGGIKIRSITYSNFMPLIAIALIYLIMVIILTQLVKVLERRLAKSER